VGAGECLGVEVGGEGGLVWCGMGKGEGLRGLGRRVSLMGMSRGISRQGRWLRHAMGSDHLHCVECSYSDKHMNE